MKLAPAELDGHACQERSAADSVWPRAISDLAIRTSTVSNLGASALTSAGLSDRPANMAATPPAPIATVRTTIRAAFIRSLSRLARSVRPCELAEPRMRPLDRISPAKGQGMVKKRYLIRVNMILRQ